MEKNYHQAVLAQATVDPLTQLSNRASVLSFLEKHTDLARRYKRPAVPDPLRPGPLQGSERPATATPPATRSCAAFGAGGLPAPARERPGGPHRRGGVPGGPAGDRGRRGPDRGRGAARGRWPRKPCRCPPGPACGSPAASAWWSTAATMWTAARCWPARTRRCTGPRRWAEPGGIRRPAMTVLLPRRIGGIRVLERLGEGGMAFVHRAEDPFRPGPPLAVKFLRPEARRIPTWCGGSCAKARCSGGCAIRTWWRSWISAGPAAPPTSSWSCCPAAPSSGASARPRPGSCAGCCP